jgi:hypothetical protein
MPGILNKLLLSKHFKRRQTAGVRLKNFGKEQTLKKEQNSCTMKLRSLLLAFMATPPAK